MRYTAVFVLMLPVAKGTFHECMRWRRLASVVSALIVLTGVKPCHQRVARVLDALFDMAHTHGGTFMTSPQRSSSVNCLYVIFSPFYGYTYVGETSNGMREH